MSPTQVRAMIALVGAESTGKTSLAQALALRINAVCLPEYLRDFCDRLGRAPKPNEQAQIVAGQLAAERAAMQSAVKANGAALVIVDSTPLLTAIYSSEYFADDSLLMVALRHQRSYALTFVADSDIAWVADGMQRDGPLVRERCQRRLIDLLQQHEIDFVLLRGDLETRSATALTHLRAAGLL
jgi:nicotinamide riboside kinase